MSKSSSQAAAMPTPENVSLHRIRRLSKKLAIACVLVSVLIPVMVIVYWAEAAPAQLAMRVHLAADLIQSEIYVWQRVLGAALTEIPVVLMIIGLMRARQCFRGFAEGALFTPQAVQALRGFAYWVMWSAIAALAITPLLSICLTFNNAVGARHVAVGIGTDHLLTFFFAAVVWLMANIIQQGHALAEENQSFV
jgi:Protein of unknown function (DUF2975)